MKTEKLAIRMTGQEREKLGEEAKSVNKSVSEYVRFLIFDKKDNDYSSILEHLSSLREGQKQQIDHLVAIDLRSKKHFRHDVILSASIFQIRYVISKVVSMLGQIYGKALPNDFELASNKAKDDFIKVEADKVAQELEAIS